MLRNTIVSFFAATAALAIANPTVALEVLSFELLMLTQRLAGMVPPSELPIKSRLSFGVPSNETIPDINIGIVRAEILHLHGHRNLDTFPAYACCAFPQPKRARSRSFG